MLKRNAIFNMILSISQVLFPMIIFPYASRILEPDGIGAVAFVDSITSICLLIAYLGIPIYGVREIAKVKSDIARRSSLYVELVTVHLCSTIVIGGLFILSSFIIQSLVIYRALIIIGASTLFFSVMTTEWFFQGMEDFAYITKRTVAVRIIFIILLFAFVRTKSDVYIYYGLMAISVLVNALFNFYHARKMISMSFSDLSFKRHVGPLLTILASNLSISIYLLIDTTLLGFMKDEATVGYYSTAMKMIKIFVTLITSLGIVFIPQISLAFKEHDFQKINNLLKKSTTYAYTLSMPICVGIWIITPFIIRVAVGDKYNESILLLRILAPLTVIIGFTNVFAWQILTPFGKDKVILQIVSVGMLLSLSLNSIFIHYYSAIGAAVVNVFAEGFVMIAALYQVKKIKEVRISIDNFYGSLFCSLSFLPVSYTIGLTSLSFVTKNVLTIALCAIIYFSYQVLMVKNEIFLSPINAFRKKITR